MKRKIYLIIIYAVTVLCVIFGCVRFIGDGVSFSAGGGSAKTTGQGTLESFDRVSSQTVSLDLTIKEGNSFSYAYTVNKNASEPEIYVKDGALYITQKKSGAHTFFGITDGTGIVITVPEGTAIKKAEAEQTSGDISIDGVDVGECRLNTASGDVFLSNIRSDSITTDLTSGDLDLDGCTVGSLEANSASGDIFAENLAVDRSLISVTSGDVILSLADSEEDHSFDLSAVSGDIVVGESVHETEFVRDGSDDRLLEINSVSGDIDLSFS